MNDERLQDTLGSLRYERMGRGADERIRRRLEEEWAHARGSRGLAERARGLVLVAGTIAFVLGLTATTLGAPGDSPLYGARIALEDAAAVLYGDAASRAQYVLGLYEQRQAEAARLESFGSAASAGARRVEQRTLETLRTLIPQAPDEDAPIAPASPTATPTATATPEPTRSPSPTPTAAPTATPSATARPVVPTAAPTVTRTEPARPTPTPTPRPTTKPTPTPTAVKPTATGTASLVVLTGTVVDADGRAAVEVCASITAGQCQTRTSTAGSYRLAVSAKIGQTVTVYAWRVDASGKITHKGTASAVVRGSTVEMPKIVLARL